MRSLIIAAFALPMLGAAALASDAGMTDAQYARANRCLALASLPVLQDDKPDLGALAAQVERETAARPASAAREAQSINRRVHLSGRQADTRSEVVEIRARRDRTCAAFLPAQGTATAQK